MNKSAGSKKFIKLVATAGTVESRITRTENIQNIPKSALGNLMEAATNAFFKNLSIARIIPSETTRCRTPTTCKLQIAIVANQTKVNNFYQNSIETTRKRLSHRRLNAETSIYAQFERQRKWKHSPSQLISPKMESQRRFPENPFARRWK